MQKFAMCPVCKGKGEYKDEEGKKVTCDNCGGRGIV